MHHTVTNSTNTTAQSCCNPHRHHCYHHPYHCHPHSHHAINTAPLLHPPNYTRCAPASPSHRYYCQRRTASLLLGTSQRRERLHTVFWAPPLHLAPPSGLPACGEQHLSLVPSAHPVTTNTPRLQALAGLPYRQHDVSTTTTNPIFACGRAARIRQLWREGFRGRHGGGTL